MKGLLAYILYQFKSNKKYRMNNVMTIMSTFIAIVIQYYIWTYVEKTNGMNTQQIIIYSMFALTLSSLLPLFSSADFMNHIILKGTIANSSEISRVSKKYSVEKIFFANTFIVEFSINSCCPCS